MTSAGFRNLLALTSCAVAVALMLIAAAHAVDTSLLNACGPAWLDKDRCPQGATSKGLDVAVIELVGLLGGLLAAIVPLTRVRRPEGPYSFRGAEVGLKATSGGATGLAGVLLIQRGSFRESSSSPVRGSWLTRPCSGWSSSC